MGLTKTVVEEPKSYQTEFKEDTGSISLATYTPGSIEEKKLLRKLDLRIVPWIWLLYCLSYLDRANIGNARSGGMEEDLGFTDNQYSVILLLFFVSYVLFEVPSNMMLTRLPPSIYLSALCFLWGAVAACMGACNSWQEVAGVRFVLGVIEAGFAPGVAFYLSSWYKRHEVAKRYAVYYLGTAVSGALSGLLAGVIVEYLDGARGIAGWRWLLIIEGAASSAAACFAWYFLADWPSTTRWLTSEEKILAAQRLAHDELGDNAGEQPSHGEAFKLAMKDWRTYFLSYMYMLATGAQTIQYFAPALVGQLGYEGYNKQYMTIPIYAVAGVFIIAFCFGSDFAKERGHFLSAAAGLACISFIIVVSVDDLHVKYGFLCLAVGGVYASCPLTLMWVANAIPHPSEKRAICIAIVNALGNTASIYGAFLWPSDTAPRYAQGFGVTAAFVGLAAISAQVFRYLQKKYPYAALDQSQVQMAYGAELHLEKEAQDHPRTTV